MVLCSLSRLQSVGVFFTLWAKVYSRGVGVRDLKANHPCRCEIVVNLNPSESSIKWG